jgi:hypothetical protein
VFHQFGVHIVQGLVNGIRATVPQLHAVMGLVTGAVSGPGSSLAASAIGAPAAGGTSAAPSVTVPITIQGGAADTTSPAYLQGLQVTVQEAVLRYNQLNSGNGLTPRW